jgi:hypothetical protein
VPPRFVAGRRAVTPPGATSGARRTLPLGGPGEAGEAAGGFRCPDEAAAKKVEQQDLAPRANDKGKGFKCSRDKEGLSVRLKVDAAGPGCGKTLKVKDEVAGKKVKCPGGGQVLRLEALAGSMALLSMPRPAG